MNNKENIYDYDYANEIREMLLEEMFSLEEIKLDLSINWTHYTIMKNNINDSWEVCFESYKTLSFGLQYMIRRLASEELVNRGAEEVGSSDTNHQIYSDWKSNSCNWDNVLDHYLNSINP